MADDASLFFDEADELCRGSEDDRRYAEHIAEYNARVDADRQSSSAVEVSEEDEEAEALVTESDIDGLLSKLTNLKDVGNGHFKAGENEQAVVAYTGAVQAAASGVKNEGRGTRKAQAAVKPVLVSLHCNAAAALLRLSAAAEAEEAASEALELEPNHAKALFRRGVARARLGRNAEAKEDLMAACRADPKDRSARDELARVQAALESQRESERAQRANFASRLEASAERECSRREAHEAASQAEKKRREQQSQLRGAEEFADMQNLMAKLPLSKEERRHMPPVKHAEL